VDSLILSEVAGGAEGARACTLAPPAGGSASAQRCAVLAADWLLRGFSDGVVVLANWRDGRAYTLSDAGAYVARSCDGATDFSSPFFLPRHRAVLQQMMAQGVAVACPVGATLDPRQRLRIAHNRTLLFAHWALTGRCNLHCRHCYLEAPAARYGEVPTSQALRIVAQLERANVVRVELSGGEPLLRRDFWALVDELVTRRIGIHRLDTNGLLLDDDCLARLQRRRLDPIIHVSYDGVGTHDDMRGQAGSGRRALAALRRAAAAGFRSEVTSSLDRATRDGIVAASEVLAGLGVRAWHVTAPYPIGCWARESEPSRLSIGEQAAVAEQLVRRWLALGRPFALSVCDLFASAAGAVTDLTPAAVAPAPRHETSPSGMPDEPRCATVFGHTVYIMPDGRLVPCPRFADTDLQRAMPSLLEAELSEVWEDERLRSLVCVRRQALLQHNPECAACSAFGECGGGCSALAYRSTGNVLARDPSACDLRLSPYRRRLAAIAEAN
jgi:radical SAM protein with 4Fe4S-binding SPASM domain